MTYSHQLSASSAGSRHACKRPRPLHNWGSAAPHQRKLIATQRRTAQRARGTSVTVDASDAAQPHEAAATSNARTAQAPKRNAKRKPMSAKHRQSASAVQRRKRNGSRRSPAHSAQKLGSAPQQSSNATRGAKSPPTGLQQPTGVQAVDELAGISQQERLGAWADAVHCCLASKEAHTIRIASLAGASAPASTNHLGNVAATAPSPAVVPAATDLIEQQASDAEQSAATALPSTVGHSGAGAIVLPALHSLQHMPASCAAQLSPRNKHAETAERIAAALAALVRAALALSERLDRQEGQQLLLHSAEQVCTQCADDIVCQSC